MESRHVRFAPFRRSGRLCRKSAFTLPDIFDPFPSQSVARRNSRRSLRFVYCAFGDGRSRACEAQRHRRNGAEYRRYEHSGRNCEFSFAFSLCQQRPVRRSERQRRRSEPPFNRYGKRMARLCAGPHRVCGFCTADEYASVGRFAGTYAQGQRPCDAQDGSLRQACKDSGERRRIPHRPEPREN